MARKRKVKLTVLYDGGNNSLFNVTANHNGNLICLLYSRFGNESLSVYNSFTDMYKAVLKLLSNNDMYVSKRELFGAVFYDIEWIDVREPYDIEHFGLVTSND